MEIQLNTGSYKVSNSSPRVQKPEPAVQSQPSFKGSKRLTSEQADALKAQYVAAQNLGKNTKIPRITENDINFQVICAGCENIKGNTRNLYDYRIMTDRYFGRDGGKTFHIPRVIRNGNGDERYNGDSTAILIPLHPDTRGKRGGDQAVIVFNGNIPKETLDELVDYMIKTKILKKDINNFTKQPRCYLNSDEPKMFFKHTNIKTVLANFFKQKAIEQSKAEKVQQVPIKETDINIRNYSEQDKNNTRNVKDYSQNFLNGGKRFMVGHSTFEENGVKKPMTVILIPTKENTDDCVAVTIDNRKLSRQQCEDLFKYLQYNGITNSENEMFRKAIVNYLSH